MSKAMKVAKVDNYPDCDFCNKKARYDGKTKMGPWANMCEDCFKKFGIGLGMGKGQKLVQVDRCGCCGRILNDVQTIIAVGTQLYCSKSCAKSMCSEETLDIYAEEISPESIGLEHVHQM